MGDWLKTFYDTDQVATKALAQPERGFTINGDGIILFQGRVYVPQGARRKFVKEQHKLLAHGHQGIRKTYNRVLRDYYFLGMRKVIEEIVTSCNLCQKSKLARHAPYRTLKPLDIPNRAWKSIS